MINLDLLKVAVLATDGFEESELIEPVRVLREAGAKVHILSPDGGPIQGFRHFDHSIRLPADDSLTEALPSDYDAVVLPGGALNADVLRMDPRAQRFLRAIDDAGKPVAVICHGGWLLVSAGLVAGRRLTSWPSIADDIRNAGGIWEDREVWIDRNWVSSRKPADLPVFCREMLALFAKIGVTRRGFAA